MRLVGGGFGGVAGFTRDEQEKGNKSWQRSGKVAGVRQQVHGPEERGGGREPL